MGSALCTLFRQKPVNVLYCGLHAAGKTTLLYKLKLGVVTTTLPTLSYNIETMHINGIEMLTWDAGNRTKLHSMPDANGIVFVVDSANRTRLPDVLDEFFIQIYPTVKEKELPVLILANKQDKEDVISPEDIKAAFYERGGEAFRTNAGVPTVALSLEGVNPAMEWLTTRLALTIARKSYLPSLSLAKVTHYPASFLKNAYQKVARLAYGDGDGQAQSEESTKSIV